jgi:beta-lactam-binding protein with PASTA domain
MLSSDRRKLRDGWVEVPFCSGELAEDAAALLRCAGVLGQIDVVHLSTQTASISAPAGRVTGTQPRRDEVVEPGATIKVFVNPGQPGEVSRQHREWITP